MVALNYSSTGIAEVHSVADAKRYITDAARAVKAAESKHGESTVKAAYATFAALKVGLIVSGKGAKREDHTLTGDQYGRMYDNLTGGGVSQSTVNLWINLGMALARFDKSGLNVTGSETDTALWRHLAFKGAGQRKEIREVLDNQSSTIEDLEAAVRKFIAPDGSKVKRETATDETATDEDGSDVAPEMALKSNLDRARAAAVLLAEIIPALTVEEFSTFAPEFQRAYDAAKVKREEMRAATPTKVTPAKRAPRRTARKAS
jgi:hypothetical protein